MMRFLRYTRRAALMGAMRLNSVLGWFGSVILLLGVVAGIAVPAVFSWPGWVPVVIVAAVLFAVFLSGGYDLWNRADSEATALRENPPIRIEGGRGGDGHNAGGGGGVAGPGGYAEGGKGGGGVSLLEMLASSSLTSGLPLETLIAQTGFTPDSPELRQRFGEGGAGGGSGTPPAVTE